MATELRKRLSDSRGNPSRWVALGFAAFLAVGAVAAVCLDRGHVTTVLALMFVTCFKVAFGRPPLTKQLVAVLDGWERRGSRRRGPP